MRERICDNCIYEDVCAPAEKLLYQDMDYFKLDDFVEDGLNRADGVNREKQITIEYGYYPDENWIDFDETALDCEYDEYADGSWHWDGNHKSTADNRGGVPSVSDTSALRRLYKVMSEFGITCEQAARSADVFIKLYAKSLRGK